LVETLENKTQARDSHDPAAEVFLHLLRHPYDLVDACRLMRQFHVSAADFQRALGKFEEATPQSTEEGAR